MDDKKQAFDVLSAKLPVYKKLFEYAEGTQPLVYSTERLKEAFSNSLARFNQNWLAVVVNSSLERLTFMGWTSTVPSAVDELGRLYSSLQLQLESYEAHRASLITHESFIIAWKDKDGAVEAYYNDPRMCHVFYDADSPKKKTYAAKWYKAQDGYFHLTLYYPDRLEYYKTKTKVTSGIPSSAEAFVPDADLPTLKNPYGVIPVFHFRISRSTGDSEITGVITLQDAVNKLFADMMVAAEFGAFKQRWIITNADTTSLKNSPSEIWTIPAEPGVQTAVGEFGEGNLGGFLDAIDKLATTLAVITRTPKHYFMSTGSNISGEALLAMEAPLIAKVEHHQKSLEVTWKELGSFLYMLQSGAVVDMADLTVIWQPAQSVQPLTEAQTIKTNVEAGVPLETSLKWAGKTDAEIEEITALVDGKEKKNAQMTQLLLRAAEIKQQQSNENPDGTGKEDEQDTTSVAEG